MGQIVPPSLKRRLSQGSRQEHDRKAVGSGKVPICGGKDAETTHGSSLRREIRAILSIETSLQPKAWNAKRLTRLGVSHPQPFSRVGKPRTAKLPTDPSEGAVRNGLDDKRRILRHRKSESNSPSLRGLDPKQAHFGGELPGRRERAPLGQAVRDDGHR